MTSLWEQLPAALQSDHSLDSLLDLLSDIDGQTGAPAAATDNDGRAVQRRTGHVNASTITGLTFDPLSGQFSHSGSGGDASPVSPTSWLTFPDLALDWVLDEYDPQPASEVALYLTLPSAVLTLPGLRGALLDANQLPQPDPAHPTVHLTLPRLTVKVHWTGVGQTETKLVSASTVPGSTGTENVYQLVRMDPTHALVGPGTIFGFGFDSAELFLDHDPPGLPPAAKGGPSPWSGVHVADAHIYVAPEGMQGVACAAGVHDLYVGFGTHSGVTGVFDALVVERGHAPTINLSFVAADGSTTRIDDAATTAGVPAGAGHLVVLLAGGVAPYTTSVAVPGGPPVTSVDVATPVAVTVPDTGTVAISVDAGAGSPVQNAPTRHITLSASAPAGGGSSGGDGGTGSVTVDDSRIRIVSSDATSVTVGLTDTTIASATWTWDGGTSTGATAVVPLAAGATTSITATYSTAGTSDVDVYFRYDHPALGEDGTDPTVTTYPYSSAPDHTSTAEAVNTEDHAAWSTGGVPVKTVPDLAARLALLPAGTATVTGHASWDHYPNDDHEAYNDQLADRRAHGAAHLLAAIADRTDLMFTTTPVGPGDGYRDSLNAGGADPAHYWRATLPNVPLTGSTTLHATLTRGTADGTPPAPPPTNRPAGPATPSWFRKLQVTLKLERSRFVELKILGEVDFYTATEHALASGSTPQHLPDRPNTMDGVTDMTLDITVDDAAATWSVDASFRAVEGDTDGLWTLNRPASGSTTAIDLVGAYAALAPVLADVAPAGPSGGDVVPLVIATAATFLLGGAGIIPVKQVTLHGVEAIVSGGPAGTQVALIVDVETKFGLSAGILTCDLDHPITTRYKAIGFALGWNAAGVDRLQPTFDATKGYTIDIPNGAIHAVSPLGDLLQVLGVNVSRDNPTYVETEIGLAADLGVVKVDRAKVRVRIDALEAPTLTGLGASIDVGVVKGSGYVSVNPSNGDVAGSLDVTLADPLNLRVMAGLKIQHDPATGALGVFVGMELDLPVPILLGSTGLGIYGFLGGVGVNMRRDEHPDDTIPALAWLQRQPQQNPIDPQGWVAAQGHWAFAVGALLGTADGGFILHLKGVLLLELPGPRLLLVMKADILSLPPGLHDASQQATILAVVDIDIGAGTITIGLVADYSILGLVSIHIPVQGFFTFADPPEWFLDVGTYAAPATVKVFDVFSGSGYLMLHGSGITPYPPFPQLATGGFTIAVGFHVDLIWGDEDVGLYLKVGAGFDAIISFAPFALAGKIVVGGELRLFIISIGANAELDVIVVPDGSGGVSLWVHGEVCGHVDFFFFSVEGCVSFELGSQPTVHHDPQPLVSGVRLVSRSPALVEGSGSDRSIDGVLANAQQQGTADPAPHSVPLDTIPVVDFDVTPITPAGFTVLGAAPGASNGAPAGGWVKRGSLWWRYTLTSVTLGGALGAGQTPTTWWTRAATVDPAEGSRLALLSWLPTPTPAAVPYGDQLVTDVHERWGSVCEPAAPPAAVLWTFDDQRAGPSATGWQLSGIAWPDPPGSTRSAVVPTSLGVHEPWRCGNAAADARRGIDAARVIAARVPCAVNRDPAQGVAVLPDQPSWLEVAADPTLAAVPLSGLRQALMRTPAPVLAFERLCPGAVLRSPFADSREPSNHRDGTHAKDVEKIWETLGFTPDPLVDAVRLDAGQGMGEVFVLVAVPRKLIEGQLVFRALGADGSELARTALTAGDIGLGRLPGEWTDPIGPWAAPVQYALEVLQQATVGNPSRVGGYVPAVVKVGAPDGTTAIDIGWDGSRLGFVAAPPFYVVGAQAVLASEQVRFSWDDASKTADRTALSTALTQEPDDHALFTPGTTYTVQVTWSAEWRDQTDAPAPADGGTAEPAVTQTFTFAADGVDAAPDRLDPWVLSTNPGPGEPGVFCDDTTRVVFATSKVADLFAAYGDTLELRLRAASGNHPQPGGPRGTGGAIASVELDPVVQAVGALRVTTPWEQAVRQVVADAGLGCIAPGTRDSHSVVEIDYPLEPCTDYLIDVVRVGNGAEELVLRRAFTTGRFRSLADVAAAFTATRVEHRALGPGGTSAGLTALTPVPPLPAPPAPPPPPATPTGDAVDAAFAQAGLDRPSVPRLPRVQVVWSTDATPQPLAVVVEAPEPLWRNHPAPALVDSDDPRSPGGKAWRDVPTNYLRLTRDASSTTAVASFVAAPGLQRGIVLLPPGQRGTTLALALARDAEPLVTGSMPAAAPIARIDLSAAPWEDPGP